MLSVEICVLEDLRNLIRAEALGQQTQGMHVQGLERDAIVVKQREHLFRFPVQRELLFQAERECPSYVAAQAWSKRLQESSLDFRLGSDELFVDITTQAFVDHRALIDCSGSAGNGESVPQLR